MSQHACRRYLPEKAGLHAQVHRHCIVSVENHHIHFIELTIGEVLIDEGVFLVIPKGDGVLFHIHGDALLKMRALER